MTISLEPDLRVAPAPKWLGRTQAAPAMRALFAALFTLTALLVLWWYAGRWYEERLLVEQRAEAVSEVSARGSALSSAVSRPLARLQGLHAFVQTEGSDPGFEQKFEQFAADLYDGSRGVRNLAVAPAGEVRYVYPLAGNESVLGYRPQADPRPEIVADVERAITDGEVILSGPNELVQGGLGIIARQAVFQNGGYWGLVNVVVDVQPLVAEAGLEAGSGRLEYALRDSQGQVFYGSPLVFSSSPIVTQITLPEGYWELAGAPLEGWRSLTWQPLLVARAGSLVSVALLVGLVYLMVNRQTSLAQAVQGRTRELSAVNEQLQSATLLLEQRVAERTQELTTLLDASRSLASTLEQEALLDQTLAQLGKVVEYHSGAILTLADGDFTVGAYAGSLPAGRVLDRRYQASDLLGQRLIHGHQPLIIPDVSADLPPAQAFRDISGLTLSNSYAFMGVPLINKKQVIGVLALLHEKPDAYTAAHADLAMAFANQAAVAIENARLHQQAQRLAVLQERQRLARELHDSVSQALYGIALGTRTAQTLLARSQLANEPEAAIGEPLDYILSLAEGGLAEMRALIFELLPESLENEDLAAALGKQAAALQARHHLAVATSLCSESDIPLPAKEVLYRVAQEALHNIVKHAHASQVSLRLVCASDQLLLEVGDDGRGFDPGHNFPGHLGLQSMRERVEQLHGALTITSAPGQGTRITASLPRS